MSTLYHIDGLCPRTDIAMGRCGFNIQLFPDWKKAVDKSGLTQQKINTLLDNMHRPWLDGCGYDALFDPDETPEERWKRHHGLLTANPGPNTHPLYGRTELRIQWGEWGPEHLVVPGDACGLDIEDGCGAPRPDVRVDQPPSADDIHGAGGDFGRGTRR